MAALPVAPEWEPVLGQSFGARGGVLGRGLLEQRAEELSLLPIRWPSAWPSDSRMATLAATYAKRVGRAVAFSLAAFRQAFAGGRDLGDRDTVLIAAAACEMHPTAVLKGLALRSTEQRLERAVERARPAGVRAVPAVAGAER